MVIKTIKSHDVLITVEENVLAGGAGEAINRLLQTEKILMPVLNIGLPDCFIEQGTREQVLELAQLDAQSILQKIQALCA